LTCRSGYGLPEANGLATPDPAAGWRRRRVTLGTTETQGGRVGSVGRQVGAALRTCFCAGVLLLAAARSSITAAANWLSPFRPVRVVAGGGGSDSRWSRRPEALPRGHTLTHARTRLGADAATMTTGLSSRPGTAKGRCSASAGGAKQRMLVPALH